MQHALLLLAVLTLGSSVGSFASSEVKPGVITGTGHTIGYGEVEVG